MAQAGEQAERSTWLDHAVRAGLIAYGVVHLMIAWVAGQLALGESSGSADNRGALHQLAEQPLGGVLVWLIALGMVLLVVWRVLETLFGHDHEDGAERWRHRAVAAMKAGAYGALGWTAIKVAAGDGSKGGTDSMTATVLSWPAGQWIVGAVGLAIIVYGLNLVRRGATDKFTEHLDAEGQCGNDGSVYLLFGRVGYCAKGAAICVVGGLVGYAAITHEAKQSGGLDQALHEILQQPYGQVLLLVIAFGIGCYGLFCFARARHLSR